MQNRIKELREERGWSMRKLAELANTSASTVNKLEKGETVLNVHWMDRLAKVFEIPAEDLLKSTRKSAIGFADDAAPYSASPGAPQIPLEDAQFLYHVKSRALDQLGMTPGAVLVVDMSPDAVKNLSSNEAVIAQYYDDMRATTLLRQYISPSLLITNSSETNAPTLNLRADDVAIKGVVIASHNFFRR